MMRTLANAARKLKRRRPHLPVFWLMTDTDRMPDPAAHVARLPRGSALTLRHYGDPARKAMARRLAVVCRARGLTLVIASDWRLAAQVGAGGVHLPEYMTRGGWPAGARLWRRARRRLLTAAAHDVAGLQRARVLQASAAMLAPVFPTRSHPDKPVLGARRFGMMARAAHIPVIALGGVNAKTMPSLMTSGCAGIAGIGFAARA